jgi:putative peptidoglycan lipid II flippase
MAGTMVLGLPVVRLIFQRGAFDQSATRATATYLILYVLSLPASALIQMLLAGFYARHDTVTPFYILVSLLALTFVFDVGLFFVLQAQGLALGLSLAKLLGAVLGFYLLNRSVGSFAQGLGRFVAKVLGASLAMAAAAAAAAFLVQRIADPLSLGSQGIAVLQLLIGGLTGIAVYALGAFVLRIPKVIEMVHLVKDRLLQSKPVARPLG